MMTVIFSHDDKDILYWVYAPDDKEFLAKMIEQTRQLALEIHCPLYAINITFSDEP